MFLDQSTLNFTVSTQFSWKFELPKHVASWNLFWWWNRCWWQQQNKSSLYSSNSFSLGTKLMPSDGKMSVTITRVIMKFLHFVETQANSEILHEFNLVIFACKQDDWSRYLSLVNDMVFHVNRSSIRYSNGIYFIISRLVDQLGRPLVWSDIFRWEVCHEKGYSG